MLISQEYVSTVKTGRFIKVIPFGQLHALSKGTSNPDKKNKCGVVLHRYVVNTYSPVGKLVMCVSGNYIHVSHCSSLKFQTIQKVEFVQMTLTLDSLLYWAMKAVPLLKKKS